MELMEVLDKRAPTYMGVIDILPTIGGVGHNGLSPRNPYKEEVIGPVPVNFWVFVRQVFKSSTRLIFRSFCVQFACKWYGNYGHNGRNNTIWTRNYKTSNPTVVRSSRTGGATKDSA